MKTLINNIKQTINASNKLLVSLSLALLMSAISLSGYSMTAKQLMEKLDELEGYKSSWGQSAMIIYPNKDNNKNYRLIKVIGYTKGNDISFNKYVYPNSVKGMKMLNRGDDIWMYFPSTGRKRKIASYNKKNSPEGVGGDFSYQDMQNEDYASNYRPKIIKEDASTWTLELTPKKTSVYKKLVLTIQKGSYETTEIKYYDQSGFFKTCFITSYKRVKGKYLIPMMLTMVNYRKGSKTVVKVVRFKVDINVPNKLFDSNKLESN